MFLIRVGCELRYQVTAPTSFLFHVTAANTPHQVVHHEKVRVEPPKEYDICYLGAEDNRVFRLQAMPGELTLHYQAQVSLNPAVDSPPQIPETDHPELPEEVLPYLNPSRYCESDRLAAFGMAEFGRLDRGYSRVVAPVLSPRCHAYHRPQIDIQTFFFYRSRATMRLNTSRRVSENELYRQSEIDFSNGAIESARRNKF